MTNENRLLRPFGQMDGVGPLVRGIATEITGDKRLYDAMRHRYEGERGVFNMVGDACFDVLVAGLPGGPSTVGGRETLCERNESSNHYRAIAVRNSDGSGYRAVVVVGRGYDPKTMDYSDFEMVVGSGVCDSVGEAFRAGDVLAEAVANGANRYYVLGRIICRDGEVTIWDEITGTYLPGTEDFLKRCSQIGLPPEYITSGTEPDSYSLRLGPNCAEYSFPSFSRVARVARKLASQEQP